MLRWRPAMTRAIHELPPIPRIVQWRAVLGSAWPLLFLGFLLAIYGGAIGVMFFFHRQGKMQDDLDLDARGKQVVGKVLAILPLTRERADRSLQRIDHEFVVPSGASRYGPQRQAGSSFVAGRSLVAGDSIEIDYLPLRPDVSRVTGGRISLAPDLLDSHLRFVLLPGLLCTLAWAWFVLRARNLLAQGDATVGDLLAVRPVPGCIPDMVRVHYSFRDRSAHLRTGTHWVRAHGRLMEWLERHQGFVHGLIVVHDRKNPRRSRLAVPADFRGSKTRFDSLPEQSKR